MGERGRELSKYTVTFPDGCEFSVDGYDMQKAAENAVENREYSQSHFPVGGGMEEVKVVVTDEGGASKTFIVEGEAVPLYSAKEVR